MGLNCVFFDKLRDEALKSKGIEILQGAFAGITDFRHDRMANHASALKRVRQTRRRTTRNRANASRLRSTIKRLEQALGSGNRGAADSLLRPTLGAIDRGIQKGILHANAAGRYKSRLARAYNRLLTQS